MTGRKKILGCLLAISGFIIVCAAAILLLLPRLINETAVKARLIALITEKSSGTVDLQSADMAWFPLPQLVVHRLSLNVPDTVAGTVETIRIYPELLSLLSGNVKLSRLRLEKPSLKIYLPEHPSEKTRSLEDVVNIMRSISLDSSHVRLQIEGAIITLIKGRQSPVILKDLDIRLVAENSSTRSLLILERLSCGQPRLTLAGRLVLEPSAPMMRIDAKGTGIDVAAVRHTALSLAADVPIVQNIFDILRSGTVEQISFQTMGSSPSDMGTTEHIKIKGRLNNGRIMISGLELDFMKVSGDCDITDGILQGRDLRGEIMHTRVSNGKLRIGLKGKDALFQADAGVSADMADVHAVLGRIVKNPEFHREMGHIRSIRGHAEGRLILGDSLSAVRAKVDIPKVKCSVNYDRIPLPVEIRHGSFSYDDKSVAVKNLEGTIGESLLSGLSARLETGVSPHLQILSGTGTVEAGQVHRWLSAYEKLREPLREISTLSGRLYLSSLTFSGQVMDSQGWDFKLTGSAEKLLIKTPLLPGPLSINSGKFEARPGQLTYSDAFTGFLDATSVISGSLDASLEQVRKGDIRFSGTFGPRSMQWVKGAFSIPEYVRTDQSISVTGARLAWKKEGETAFEGSIRTGSGQTVVIDLVKDSGHLAIKRLDVSDSVSKASFGIDLQENKKQLNFKGRLDTSTAAGLITPPQIKGGMVQGEISIVLAGADRSGISAHGKIQGERIIVPWRKDSPLRIDSLNMSAEKGSISIGSARLAIGESAAALTGKIQSNAGGLVLDMDVSSEGIVWDDIVKPAIGGIREAEPEKKNKPLAVQGVVRLKTDRFDYQGFQLSPFHADLAISAGKTAAKIGKSNVCGVGMTGDISLMPDTAEMGLDIRFDAADQELKPTVLCMSKGKSDASGRFTFRGHIKGRGRIEEIRDMVEGKVELTAKKGIIYRYKTLDTVFDFLNKEEELAGQMPDLDKSELSYELFKVRASISRGTIVIEEAIIDSRLVGVVAQGSLNLTDNRLDLNVMVTPLRQVKKIVGKIPVVGPLISGTLISVPVKVTGTPADPIVTYLSPSAAVSNLANIMKQTINLPVRILSPLFPKGKQE